MHQAKEITKEEARHLFLGHMADLVRYWENEKRAPTSKEKLEGLLFSILVTLDGGSAGQPGYYLVPGVHPEDKDYAIKEGFDYHPPHPVGEHDIGGSLHEEIGRYLRGEVERPANLYDFGAFLVDQARKFHNSIVPTK